MHNRPRHLLPALVFALGLLVASPAGGQCQHQTCDCEGSCCKCTDVEGANKACQTDGLACPQSCTIRRCGKIGDILPLLQPPFGDGVEQGCVFPEEPTFHLSKVASNSTEVLARSAVWSETGNAKLVFGMMDQSEAPAELIEITVTTKGMMTRGKLLSRSKTLQTYRLGWVILIPNKSPEVQFATPALLAGGLKARAASDVPGLGVSFSPLRERDVSSVGIKFFVAGVTFDDGSSWEADIQEVTRAAQEEEHPRQD